MKSLLAIGFICSVCLFAGGCAHGFGGPWFSMFSPGTHDQQRSRAAVHDPFSDNDAGPAVEGVRPREFDKPLAEPERVRLHRDSQIGVTY